MDHIDVQLYQRHVQGPEPCCQSGASDMARAFEAISPFAAALGR
ncbi:hypothetical protein ACODT5_15965 [Streptomyces sp. 5.8]